MNGRLYFNLGLGKDIKGRNNGIFTIVSLNLPRGLRESVRQCCHILGPESSSESLSNKARILVSHRNFR
jgi:hypothetical protein